jgi:superfamily II DNA/RNA helicase
VNYECPEDEKTYVHRIGRTGRAGRAGVAITFVDWRDMHRWKLINDALSLGMAEPEETYSTSEHLYTVLDIPREATGTLPRSMRDRAGLEAEVLEDIGETGKIRTPRPSKRNRGSSSRRGSSARGGSGQARKSGQEAAEGTPAGEVARTTRRRRRTRAGREIGPDQTGTDQVSTDQGETRRKAS